MTLASVRPFRRRASDAGPSPAHRPCPGGVPTPSAVPRPSTSVFDRSRASIQTPSFHAPTASRSEYARALPAYARALLPPPPSTALLPRVPDVRPPTSSREPPSLDQIRPSPLAPTTVTTPRRTPLPPSALPPRPYAPLPPPRRGRYIHVEHPSTARRRRREIWGVATGTRYSINAAIPPRSFDQRPYQQAARQRLRRRSLIKIGNPLLLQQG